MGLTIETRSFPDPAEDLNADASSGTLVLAGGCFWCTEAVFELLEGVDSVRPVYAGGSAKTANYQAVCTGQTGHAEAIEIRYDPSEISYGQLLKIFFSVAHDPTQLNRQGADVGTQYRSAIFYATEDERRVAEAYIHQLDEAGVSTPLSQRSSSPSISTSRRRRSTADTRSGTRTSPISGRFPIPRFGS